MNKFIKGRWYADDCGRYIFTKGENIPIAEIRGWGYLTGSLGLSDDEAYKIQKANARLIAASPEMYDWIKRFLRRIGVTANNGYVDECRVHGDIREILALLKRIDGEEDVK